MLRSFVRRFGITTSTVTLTVISIFLSVLITVIVTRLFNSEVQPEGLSIAVVVPLLVAPLPTYSILSLAYRLDRAEARLQHILMVDDLTLAYSRRYFYELAEKELSRARRYNSLFSIVIFDIDDFKLVNDHHGHLSGDEVLRGVSKICLEQSRQSDIFARYGGEEFIYLLPNTSLDYAGQFAERIRSILENAALTVDGKEIHITVSLGAATYQAGAAGIDALIAAADRALYEAKSQGKNRVVVSEARIK